MTSTTKSYRELLAQRVQLEADIAAARALERRAALQRIRHIMTEYDITAAELHGRRMPQGNVTPKYRDPVSGTTWSGRGRPPRWMVNQDREKFRIDPDVNAASQNR